MKKILLIFPLIFFLSACSLFTKPVISDFQSCVKAKNAILNTFPRQCRDLAGQLYVEKTALPIWIMPDSELPAAGVCLPANLTDFVQVEINQDVPNPRCQKMNHDQRLKIKNNTAEVVKVWFGENQQYLFNIPGNSDYEISQSVSELLAPGVHILYGSPYQGPEIWVNN